MHRAAARHQCPLSPPVLTSLTGPRQPLTQVTQEGTGERDCALPAHGAPRGEISASRDLRLPRGPGARALTGPPVLGRDVGGRLPSGAPGQVPAGAPWAAV